MSIVKEITSRLDEYGIGSGRVNAEAILSTILGCRPVDLYTEDIDLNDSQLKKLEHMVSRRINGEPLQYITGKVNFYGNEFLIKKGVFIPRPETEILVDTVISLSRVYDIQNTTYEPWILDLCTGSGNIAISLTKALAHCKMIASDISEQALCLAEENATCNSVCERIEFIKADLLDIGEKYKGLFDIIITNPPYVDPGILGSLSAEVRQEPRLALDGGQEGLDFYQRIIQYAPYFLKVSGFMALELADGLSRKVKDLLEASGRFKDIRIFKDLKNIERVITAVK